MKKRIIFSSLILASSLTYAADFKLGYVDVNKVFMTSKPALALQAELKTTFAPQQQSLQSMNDKLLGEQAQMQAIMKKAPSMDKLSATDKASLEKLEVQYQKDQVAFQQKYVPFQQTLQRAQDLATSILLGKANIILKTISENGGYDLVLTSNQLVYAKPKYDLTDQIIAQLNKVNGADLVKEFNKELKQPANPGALGLSAAAANGATTASETAVTSAAASGQ
jgi:outer membrane protein